MASSTPTRSEVLTVRVAPALRAQIQACAWIESDDGSLDFTASRYLHDLLEDHVRAILAEQPGGVAGSLARYRDAVREARQAEIDAEMAELEAAVETVGG